MNRKCIFAGLLCFVSLFQMVGDLFHITTLKAFGAAWGMSPCPKVFSSQDGLETFSSKFFFSWEDHKGTFHRVELTPERAKNLMGPYNRRNVYGAVLSYGPLFQKNEALRGAYESVLDYAFNGNGTLLQELGITPETKILNIEVVPQRKHESKDLELIKKIELKREA